MLVTMAELQVEHKAWLDAMYKDQPSDFPACGMVEEAAELMHAMLKHSQKHVWGEEPRYRATDWRAEMFDAIGDCAIYLCSYCNTVGWNFEKLCAAVPAVGREMPLRRGALFVGLAAAFVSNQTWEQAYLYMSELKGISQSLHIDFDDAVRTTWLEVKTRCR